MHLEDDIKIIEKLVLKLCSAVAHVEIQIKGIQQLTL